MSHLPSISYICGNNMNGGSSFCGLFERLTRLLTIASIFECSTPFIVPLSLTPKTMSPPSLLSMAQIVSNKFPGKAVFASLNSRRIPSPSLSNLFNLSRLMFLTSSHFCFLNSHSFQGNISFYLWKFLNPYLNNRKIYFQNPLDNKFLNFTFRLSSTHE